jgi:alpha-tubulin suppressor-like RCC1 family protein
MSHTALLTAKGHLYTMGSNLKGQLGIGSSSSVPLTVGSPMLVEKLKHYFVDQVSCGSDFTFTVVRQKENLTN